jgi:hypothetical protein
VGDLSAIFVDFGLMKKLLTEWKNPIRLYVDWGSRFVGDVNWCSVVGTGISGPTLSVL